MKKRSFTLSALLITSVVLALLLGIMPLSVLADSTASPALTGTKLTTAHAGQTLQEGEYYVEPGTTLTLRGGTGKSGLTVATGKTVTIHIPAGSTLNVYGGAASGTTGAGAGIEVSATSNLKIIGSGTLNAYGGKAANGGSGGRGEDARWGDDDYSYIPDSGYGGSGGGGAGAGIGTKGGAGGAGAGWRTGFYGGRTTWTDNFMDRNHSGYDGLSGKNGLTAGACGGVYVAAGVTVNAKGGAAGTSGGSGGSAGSRDYESDDHTMRGIAGGSGGGGGGAGKQGADIGTGGGGGGGGGSGGGVGYAWSCWFLGAGGGGGGAGAVGGYGGAWSSDGAIPDHDCGKYDGGKETSSWSGNAGGTTSGGTGGSGCKVKIRKTDSKSSSWEYPHGGNGGVGGNAGNSCTKKSVQSLFLVTIESGETATSFYAGANTFLPSSLGVAEKVGYTFKGYYGTDGVQYYDDNGNRTTEKITGDVTISAKLDVNEYQYTVNRDPQSSGGSNAENGGTVAYGNAITLTTPNRDGYLFRGWKISATSGNLNTDAYYAYTTAAPRMRMLRNSAQQTSEFIQEGNSFLTAGRETIGDVVTLYNLSADDNATLTIEEIWVLDHFEVTFKDFDGTELSTQTGTSATALQVPTLSNRSDYYTYTFKYWKCNIDGKYYKTEELPLMGGFLAYESELGDAVYTGITFTAVYDLEYKKELELVGSLGNNTNLTDGVLILEEGSHNIPVVTNFKITKNAGVASLLLIPQYDASVFSIKAISINGECIYGEGATSVAVLNGFTAKVTGKEVATDLIKIHLDSESVQLSNAVSQEVFVQIIYEMKQAIGGKYEFGFVTADYTKVDTDKITHGDRSEAYGIYDPNAYNDKDSWKFNELKITVDSTAIKVVVRVDGSITITENQSFVYNGAAMGAADVTQEILNALQYTYNGYIREGNTPLTITWYDAQGNVLSEAPKNVGTYRIGIRAAETTYYHAVAETFADFTITPYEIVIVAGDQIFAYTGSNILIDMAAAKGELFTKDAQGNLIPVDEFVGSELKLNRVELTNSYTNAGVYTGVIRGIPMKVGDGNLSNYHITYRNGTLTITRAVNAWIGELSAPGGVYNGQKYDTVIFDAEFGKNTALIEYFYGYETNSDGTKTEIWKTEAPANAGKYTVRITIPETTNYSGLVTEEILLEIAKKVISPDGFTFEAIDKIYNGENQYWSVDPDGDPNTDDSEVELIASGENASLLQYISFVGMIHPLDRDCTNAGTYLLQAMLEISNPNYTFKDEKGREVDTWTCDGVEVEITKRHIIVNANDQEREYDGQEPGIKQGKDYINSITLPDGTTAPFINLDFFGGVKDSYSYADEYVADASYYKLVNGQYVAVVLTAEEFAANLALLESDETKKQYVKYYRKTTDTVESSETLTLYKNAGVSAGVYELLAALGDNSNYVIDDVNGTFTITKCRLELPTLGETIYNNAAQRPTVAPQFADIYQFIFVDGVDYIHAGRYEITVHLTDPNYQWIVDGAQDTDEDQKITWKINPKEIIVQVGNSPSFVYGDRTPIDTWISEQVYRESYKAYTWKEGYEPFDGEELELVFAFAEDYHLTAGQHQVPVVGSGSDAQNYTIFCEGGVVSIEKKVLTKQDIADAIQVAVKYYTGNPLSLSETDFLVKLLNLKENPVIRFNEIVSIPDGATDANGTYNESTKVFTYYADGNRYSVTVNIGLIDNTNYRLDNNAATMDVDVQAFIAQARNSWTTEPSIDATAQDAIKINAQPQFGDIVIKYYSDKECQQEVTELEAEIPYYAIISVLETKNFSDLTSQVLSFKIGYIIITRPTLKLDAADGSDALAGQPISIVYDGAVHTFFVPAAVLSNDRYTVTITEGDWKNVGTYTVTIALKNNENGQVKWDNDKTDALVYTLEITKKSLTITADDKTVTYLDAAPAYTMTANGLVANETLETLLGDQISQLFNCSYAQGSHAGTYVIQLKNTINLGNYDITYVNGTLTVKKYQIDYDQIGTGEGSTTLADLIKDGLTFTYNNEGKAVPLVAPDALTITVTYLHNNVVLSTLPQNAGEYQAIITVQIQDPTVAGNYELPEAQEIQITIEKAKIKIEILDKFFEYSGDDYKNKFPMSATGGYEITFENGAEFAEDGVGVTAFTIADGTYVNANTYAEVISVAHTYNDNYIVSIVCGDLVIAKATNSWTSDLNVKQDITYTSNPLISGEDFFSSSLYGEEVYTFYEKVGNSWIKIDGAPTQAGDYRVVATVPGNQNYDEIESGRVEFTISKKIIQISDITFSGTEVTYNGQPHYISVSGDFSSMISIVCSGDGQVNAGTYTVTATVDLTDTRNYELQGERTKETTLTIKKVNVTITADDKESMFGDPIKDLTYVIVFDGDAAYRSFYEQEFGGVDLITHATSDSVVGTYGILSDGVFDNDNYAVTFVDGTYTVTKFIGNKVTVTAEDVRYLMELVYGATALRGNTIRFTFATSEDGEYTTTLPKNVGTYYVKATVDETENYDGASAIIAFNITKAQLSGITDIVYNADTATWNAVVTTTDGYTIDCEVVYLVDGQNLSNPAFKATKTGTFNVIAVPSDTENYESSDAVALHTVYSVSFADKVENHDKQTHTALLTDPAFSVQYRFEGQAVTIPDVDPTIEGYTFRTWQLNNTDYSFASGVYSNITLYAVWTRNSYTIYFYNEVVTGSSVQNGVFIEGEVSDVLVGSKTFYYGDTIAFLETIPTKEADVVYTYTFAYWADALRGNQIVATYVVTGDDAFYAVYDRDAQMFTITYMVSIDGAPYKQYKEVVVMDDFSLEQLAKVTWFYVDSWYTDRERTNRISDDSDIAQDLTLYAAYVFDIGAGDVNADGKIDVDDILLYRQWVVGGYLIEAVEPGSEWALVHSDAFKNNTNTLYFVERVNDANRDDSGDIRDITTLRMALTKGYGYDVVSGKTSAAGVTGAGVVMVLDTVPGVETPDSLMSAVNGAGAETIYIKLTEDLVLTESLIIPAGKTVVLDLNGHTISQSVACTKSYQMIHNMGSLTINDSVGTGKISFTDTGAGDPNAGWGSYTIVNSGVLIVNGGTVENLSEQNKGQGFMHMVSAIDQGHGSTTINGGVISTPHYRSIRIRSGSLTITNGILDGQVWLQTHKNSVISLHISGGDFSPNWNDGSSVFIGNDQANCTVNISGGNFQTKIGCSDADKLTGVVTGGVFTASAKDNTNAALIHEDYEFAANTDGTYCLSMKELQ